MQAEMAPSYFTNYRIGHCPSDSGCPGYVRTNRSFVLPKATTSVADLEEMIERLKAGAILDPISKRPIYCPFLVYYAQVTHDLDGQDDVRLSMASFISPLPPRHPYRLIFEPFLARDRNQFSTGLTNILGSVMTDPRKSYDAATGSETIDRGMYSGFLAEAIRHAYTKERLPATQATARDLAIPPDVFWAPKGVEVENDGEEEGEDAAEDDDEEDEHDHSR
ncbi:hypothetical protein BMF94_0060 [Rhodotorula taiwanensis]|uniref:Uncharacterized protein n=1 Tax=Rhodotorula taiwanensis TaxID=741276 RepID=A0A2S5BJ81_9BASI|nr:hypothetical protein BMF94_0060 [Rhodotorula taiwanensis]